MVKGYSKSPFSLVPVFIQRGLLFILRELTGYQRGRRNWCINAFLPLIRKEGVMTRRAVRLAVASSFSVPWNPAVLMEWQLVLGRQMLPLIVWLCYCSKDYVFLEYMCPGWSNICFSGFSLPAGNS